MKLDKIGADVEFFVEDGELITSAIGKIGGSKETPRWLSKGNVQEDNVLAEMAINPASSKQEFISNIFDLKEELLGVVAESGLSLNHKPFHYFSTKELSGFGEEATVLGCDPDYNAYNGMQNPPPNGDKETIRTASGHVHFSYNGVESGVTSDIIINMDHLLGLWSVLEDGDDKRRTLYGKSGSMRPKPYGGEYRSLSNFWTTREDYIGYVYDATVRAVEGASDMTDTLIDHIDTLAVNRAINYYDKIAARRLLERVERLL